MPRMHCLEGWNARANDVETSRNSDDASWSPGNKLNLVPKTKLIWEIETVPTERRRKQKILFTNATCITVQ